MVLRPRHYDVIEALATTDWTLKKVAEAKKVSAKTLVGVLRTRQRHLGRYNWVLPNRGPRAGT